MAATLVKALIQHGTKNRQKASTFMQNNDVTLIMAPLQGFTDVTFRNVYARHFSGVDHALAPFISTMGEKRLKPSRIMDVAPQDNRSLPVTPQILGNVAQDFIFLARHLAEMGHTQVNWNLGCPHSKIAKKMRGSGLLMFPETIDTLLAAITAHIPVSLSVKIRLGRQDKEEIHDLIHVLNRHPIDHVILHPRTGIQMYRGKADLDAFEAAMEASIHPFVYNGDITDTAFFSKVTQRFPGIRRFMIGRGILANPFLPEQIKGILPDLERRVIRLQHFHDDLVTAYAGRFSGPGHLTGRMKGFWHYLGNSFKNQEKPLKKILRSPSFHAYSENVAAFFETGPEFLP
jgi:tRNA-dihydrouridine synthase B